MPTGFTTRHKGKIVMAQGSVDRFGKGSGASFPLSGQIFTYASTTGTGNGADTTEDLLQSFTLPANCFDQVGRGLQIVAFGTTTSNTNTKIAKLYFGSEAVSITNNAAGVTSWYLEMNVMKSGSNAQVMSTQAINNAVSNAHAGTTTLTGTETDTAGILVKLTGQNQTAATANSVVLNGLSIFAMN